MMNPNIYSNLQTIAGAEWLVPQRGEYGDTTQRCAYCRKPHTSYLWSSRNARYCSHRCLAADMYMCNAGCLCCLIPFSYMMYIAVLNVIAGIADYSFYDPTSAFIISILVWFSTALILYTVYVGYTTDREPNLDDIHERIPPELSDPDWD